MDDFLHNRRNNPNPKAKAGILSRITFLYTLPTFLQGLKKVFTEDDIYETLTEHKANRLGTMARKLWEQELENCKRTKQTPSLFRILLKMFGRHYLILLILLALIELGPRLLIGLALGEFIQSYGSDHTTTTYFYACAVITCCLASFAMVHPYHLMCSNAGLKIQVVCSTLIYNKILRLNQTALRQTTPGQIVNMLSNDINTFETCFNLTHHIWIAPIHTFLVLYITYRKIGISGILGASLIFLFIPIHYISGRLISKYRLRTSVKRDERIRLTNEIIQGINIIKMYAWEKPFALIVASCRNLEIKSIQLSSYIKGFFSLHAVFITTSIFIMIINSSLFKITISAKNAFIITTLYNAFGMCFMLFLPHGIASLQEGRVSIKRITKFLLHNETEIKKCQNNKDYAVSIKNGSAKWDQSSDQYTFTKFNCSIKYGTLTTIIGPVGCGKSSLLHLFLQELPVLTGDLNVNGTISYASQEPWIFCASVRNNILFGSQMNEKRYRKVIKCCALEHDLKLFPYGDSTTVGERGTSLSGGQKARINLARAVYRDADIYLLDDPLSAVDTHVGKQIFENCIQTFLKQKTVILITHQLQYLKYVDHIIVLDNGMITAEGSPAVLEKTGFDCAKYLQNVEEDNNINFDSKKEKHVYDSSTTNQAPKMQAEAQSFGTMSFSIYKDYILASKSYVHVVFAFACFALAQIFTSLSFSFVAYWVKFEREEHLDNYEKQRTLNIYIYSAITLFAIGFTIMRTTVYVNLSMKSSKVLHNSMFAKVVHASIKFFNDNPSGRILNRFAKDLGTIDEILPSTAIIAIRTLFTVAGSLVVVCMINAWFIIPTAIILILVYFMRKVYLLTNLNVIRVESIIQSMGMQIQPCKD